MTSAKWVAVREIDLRGAEVLCEGWQVDQPLTLTIKAALEALAPFSKIDELSPRDDDVWAESDSGKTFITCGHLRAAAKALAEYRKAVGEET